MRMLLNYPNIWEMRAFLYKYSFSGQAKQIERQGEGEGSRGDNLLKLVVDFNMERKNVLLARIRVVFEGWIRFFREGVIRIRMNFTRIRNHGYHAHR